MLLAGQVLPVAHGATGMRNIEASSITSAVVRSRVHAWVLFSNSSRRAGSIRTMAWPSRSARPMRTRKSLNIWAALVLNPTHPSSVGSIEGNSTTRGGWGSGGLPMRLIMRSVNSVAQTHITSVRDTSMWAPSPVRMACWTATRPVAAP